jgi:hypothetical protein
MMGLGRKPEFEQAGDHNQDSGPYVDLCLVHSTSRVDMCFVPITGHSKE